MTQSTPGPGHNSASIASEQLRSYVERIERLEEEKAGLAADVRDIYAEAKGTGFDTRTIREVIKLRKLDAEDRRERRELLDLYLGQLGIFA